MKSDIVNEKAKQADEPIVIADECGDSMWDAVLGQEVKACEIKKENSELKALFNIAEQVKECDPDKSGLAATEVK